MQFTYTRSDLFQQFDDACIFLIQHSCGDLEETPWSVRLRHAAEFFWKHRHMRGKIRKWWIHHHHPAAAAVLWNVCNVEMMDMTISITPLNKQTIKYIQSFFLNPTTISSTILNLLQSGRSVIIDCTRWTIKHLFVRKIGQNLIQIEEFTFAFVPGQATAA